MTRVEYQRDISKQLNEIEGRDGYCFHVMTHQGVEEKFVTAVKDAVAILAKYTSDDATDIKNAETARMKFAKIAAMCMIAMDTADLKKNMALNRTCNHDENAKNDSGVYKNFLCKDKYEERIDCMKKDIERYLLQPALRDTIENHKSHWIPDSKGGESNCRR